MCFSVLLHVLKDYYNMISLKDIARPLFRSRFRRLLRQYRL